ncbi:MAG: excalibur calcium-binding domain-containing protein [Novosphingobium sp.]
MSFRKPFRAVPIKLGAHYRRKQRSNEQRSSLKFLGIAAVLGVSIGTGSIALTPDGRSRISTAIRPFAIQAGIVRAREPQVGDYWAGCNSARSAGTAPIYRGEPGYRVEMDGDSDGVACEPYHGN